MATRTAASQSFSAPPGGVLEHSSSAMSLDKSPGVFEQFFATEYGKMVPDAITNVTIDITIEGEPTTITLSLEELASVLQPCVSESLLPLSRFRRVPKVSLPPVDMVTPVKYFQLRPQSNVMCGVVALLARDVSAELLPIIENLSQGKMETLVAAFGSYCILAKASGRLIWSACDVEFNRGKNEKGSIMRGSSFAVQVLKACCLGSEYDEYRRQVLAPVLKEIVNNNGQIDLQLEGPGPNADKQAQDLCNALRSVIKAITSETSLNSMPRLIRFLCFSLASWADKVGLTKDEREGQVAGFLMLRFFVPCVVAPWTHAILSQTASSTPSSAAESASIGNLKNLARTLQKFCTGLTFSEDYMAPVNAVFAEILPMFRTYLTQTRVDPLGKDWEDMLKGDLAPVSEEDTVKIGVCSAVFAALAGMPAYVEEKSKKDVEAGKPDSPWKKLTFLLTDLRYVNRLQLMLQSEISYMAALEKIEEQLRKIASGVMQSGDPFEATYTALQKINTWHESMFMMLHDRLEVEWGHCASVADWLHRFILEFESVYQAFGSGFLFMFRNLVDVSRDIKAEALANPGSVTQELYELIDKALMNVGRPLKRLMEILTVLSDAHLPDTHPDHQPVNFFVSRGKELLEHMRSQINIGQIMVMGDLEKAFVEKLDLLQLNRHVIRQGVFHLQDGQTTQEVNAWLFNDVFLCGVPKGSEYRLLFKIPLLALVTRAIPGDDLTFTVAGIPEGTATGSLTENVEDRSSRRASRSMQNLKEYRLTSLTVKAKGLWLTAINEAQEHLQDVARRSRASTARGLLPQMSSSDWNNVFMEASRVGVADGEYVLKEGQVNVKLFRIAEGKVSLRKKGTELLKLGQGDIFGHQSLCGADFETLAFDAVAVEGAVILDSVNASVVLATVAKDDSFKRRLMKSTTTALESLLRKTRLRCAASKVLAAKTLVSPPVNDAVFMVLRALEEAENAHKGAYTKLDIADILLGSEPAEFSTGNITAVFPTLLEMHAYGSAMGTAYTRAQWSGVIAALEADKLVSTARDGGPVLTRKGKSALSQPADAFVAPKTIKDVLGNFEEGGNLLESVFGLRNEELVAQFQVSGMQFDKMFFSPHYVCFSGRVLGVGVEKKKIINLGHVLSCELKKKVLEIHYITSGEGSKGVPKAADLKISFKTASESGSAHSILQKAIDERARLVDSGTAIAAPSKSPRRTGRLSSPADGKSDRQSRRSSVTLRHGDKTVGTSIISFLESCPTRTFEGGTVLTANVVVSSDQTPCLFVLQDVAKVTLVAKMAAGDVPLHEVDEGTIFAPDGNFFGLTDEGKLCWMCDENSEVVVREVSSSALADAAEMGLIMLKWLAQVQCAELNGYLSNLH